MGLKQTLEQRKLLGQLAKARASGNKQDRDSFYRGCFLQFHDVLWIICHNYGENEAGDRLGEVFLKIMTANIQYFPVHSYIYLRNYLCKIAANHCKTEKRKAKRKHLLELNYSLNRCQILTEPEESEKKELLNRALNYLSKTDQLIFKHRLNGYPIREISTMLDITETAISTRLSRAREKLKNIVVEL